MKMRAVQVRQPGNIEDLYINENFEKPASRDHHVLIKVHATAINRADTLQVAYLWLSNIN